MTITEKTLTDGSITVDLQNDADWDEFFAANAEGITDAYFTKAKAFASLKAHGLVLGGGAAPIIIVYFNHNNPPIKLPPCKFTFDDETVWDGFAHGSTWNGFDNVAVSKETLDDIIAHYKEMGDDCEDFASITPLDNGLYSLGWGFATQIVPEASRHFTVQIWRKVVKEDYVVVELVAASEAEAKAKAQEMVDEGEFSAADWQHGPDDDDVQITSIHATEFTPAE